MKKAMFILNPSSGKELAGTYKDQTIETLQEMGYEVHVKETQGEGDATDFARQACVEKYHLVTAMGGDGTINEAVNGLAEQEHRPIFSFIPLGTVNDFARALGIPLDPVKAIEALKTAEPRFADIAKAQNKFFMNILAVGRIAENVSHVSVEQKTKLGALAYLIEGVKALTSDEETEVSVEHDHGTWKGNAVIVLAALTNSVGGFEKLAPNAETDDGLLHVFVVKSAGIPAFLRMASAILRGKLEEDPDVIVIKTKKARIETTPELSCNLDGDEGCTTPIDVKILERHIELLVPIKEIV
ncbi:diacylglycerol kinase family lipid kinase [Paenisporosarcina quisquiliarum]|uniref:Diacylglycerol kinase family lipid kinase n=1 Tax=Paenisporosarcina quisquiliarum TaxID=365346 RepID=A0A9X3RDV9_9BACL|nr:diacylglycerol kinase family protein [Paenisporosarcina quisquiliarum]MCZ8536733.1 diacylglycerol kinase family lipid kinase [Paenisporosarcina quisquiliarum]